MDSPFFFESTVYWSEGDEQAHFDWLSRIGCISEVRGRGNRVYLAIDPAAVSEADLRELHAIYCRFGGNLNQLDILEESTNVPNP